MHVTDATEDDIPHIKEIWNHYIRTSTLTFKSIEKTQADVRAALSANPAFLVIKDADVTGFATCFQFRAGEGYIHAGEHTILLHPDQRGNGKGRALLTALEQSAKQRGFRSLTGGICAENQSAIAFHSACGYKTVGTVQQVGRKFDRWLDLVFVQKLL